MYFRYIDDQNHVTEALPPGTRWEGEKLSFVPEKIEAEKEIPAHKMTMRELRKMGISINEMIQLEPDNMVPTHHDNKKLPILDLNVWIERKYGNDTPSEKVRHQFYRKPMANPLLIMARLAMPDKVKRTELTQPTLRIMKNTSPELAEKGKTQLLSEFSSRIRASGYGTRYRFEIINNAMTAFDRMKEEQEHVDRPINRPRSYQPEVRRKKNLSAKSNWYQNGGYSTVMFVPATSQGKRANMLRESERKMAQERGWPNKIVERGG